MNLPRLESLVGLDERQLANAGELIGILGHADQDVFLPSWEVRTAMMSEIMERHGATFSYAVGAAACNVAGVEPDRRSAVLAEFYRTGLQYCLSDFGGYAHVSEDVETKWQQAIIGTKGIERAIQNAYPRFIHELNMLGSEYVVGQLGEILLASSTGTVRHDLYIFIGEPEDDESVGWDPDRALGALELDIMRYDRFAHRGYKPIDPERLVGTVATAMTATSMA